MWNRGILKRRKKKLGILRGARRNGRESPKILNDQMMENHPNLKRRTDGMSPEILKYRITEYHPGPRNTERSNYNYKASRLRRGVGK